MQTPRDESRLLLAVALLVTGCGDQTPMKIEEMGVAQVAVRLSLGDAAEKRAAAQRLGDLEDPAGVSALLKALEDEDFKVRSAAVRALGKIRDLRAVPALSEILTKGDPILAYDVVDSLARIGGPSAISALLTAEKNAGRDIGRRIREDFLPKLLGKDEIPFLESLARDSQGDLKAQAAKYLKWLREKYPPETPPTPSPTVEPTPEPPPPPPPPPPAPPPATRSPPPPAPTGAVREPPPLPDGAGYTTTRPTATTPVGRPPTPTARFPEDKSLYGGLVNPTGTSPTVPPRRPPARVGTEPDGTKAYQPVPVKPGDRAAAELLFRAAWEEDKAGRHDAAVEKYRKAMITDASFPDSSFNLGVLLARIGRLDDAEKAYQRSLDADPSQAEVRLSLGAIYLRKDEPRKAVEELLQAVRSPKATPAWWLELGKAQAHAGYPDAAAKSYLAASQQGDFHGAWEAGHLLLAEERFAEAAEAYATAARLGRGGPDARYNEGVAWYKAKDWDKAEKAFQGALEADADHGPTHFSLAAIYLARGDKGRARLHTEKARSRGQDVAQLEAALAKLE